MTHAERVLDVIARMRGGYEPSDVLEQVDYIWADAIVEALKREGLINERNDLLRRQEIAADAVRVPERASEDNR